MRTLRTQLIAAFVVLSGEPLGYVAVERAFATASHDSPRRILDHLSAVAEAWTRGEPPPDDITFVAVKVS